MNQRRVRLKQEPAPLSIDLVLEWADAHFKRKGSWPGTYSGLVREGPLGENWRQIDNALRYGLRGLEGKTSLTKLLSERRGIRNHKNLPCLTDDQILGWADAYFTRN